VANQGAEMRRIIRQNGGTTFKVSMFIWGGPVSADTSVA
jgi:hypothetical protein